MDKKKFLEEAPGRQSSMRVMCFFALIAAIGFGVVTLQNPTPEGVYITFGFLLSAFAPKALQKYAETRP